MPTHQMTSQKKPAPSASKYNSKRRNIYFRSPAIYDALQQAVAKGLIKSRSASERVEELLATEVRRLAPKLRAAGVKVPAELFTK